MLREGVSLAVAGDLERPRVDAELRDGGLGLAALALPAGPRCGRPGADAVSPRPHDHCLIVASVCARRKEVFQQSIVRALLPSVVGVALAMGRGLG
jgi:hypothetical protein